MWLMTSGRCTDKRQTWQLTLEQGKKRLALTQGIKGLQRLATALVASQLVPIKASTWRPLEQRLFWAPLELSLFATDGGDISVLGTLNDEQVACLVAGLSDPFLRELVARRLGLRAHQIRPKREAMLDPALLQAVMRLCQAGLPYVDEVLFPPLEAKKLSPCQVSVNLDTLHGLDLQASDQLPGGGCALRLATGRKTLLLDPLSLPALCQALSEAASAFEGWSIGQADSGDGYSVSLTRAYGAPALGRIPAHWEALTLLDVRMTANNLIEVLTDADGRSAERLARLCSEQCLGLFLWATELALVPVTDRVLSMRKAGIYAEKLTRVWGPIGGAQYPQRLLWLADRAVKRVAKICDALADERPVVEKESGGLDLDALDSITSRVTF